MIERGNKAFDFSLFRNKHFNHFTHFSNQSTIHIKSLVHNLVNDLLNLLQLRVNCCVQLVLVDRKRLPLRNG